MAKESGNNMLWFLLVLLGLGGGAFAISRLNKSKPASSNFTYTGNTVPSFSPRPSVPKIGCGCGKKV